MNTERGRVRADIVVVAYNSGSALRDCVGRLHDDERFRVIVVDNASPRGGLETVADLDVDVVANPRNGGFAYGCNAGWRIGSAPYVLLLNPDARIGPGAVALLCDLLDAQSDVGIVAPRIRGEDGRLAWSLRRFPRPASTFGYALGVRSLVPSAAWTDELIRDRGRYDRPSDVEWASGACLLVRRELLERLGGLDEGFFLYCEDKDLCRRTWNAGMRVRFEPAAECRHAGGGSAPRPPLREVLTASRIRYARLHAARAAPLEILGIALGEATHALGGLPEMRASHRRSALLAARSVFDARDRPVVPSWV